MAKNIPKYLIVEDRIKQAIKSKEITGKLPGERTLAKDFGFSYMTIRKAVDNLVKAGILYRVPMKGTFVASKKSIKNRTRNIGYFLDSSIKDGLTSPYYSMIFNALEKAAANRGYALIFFSDLNDSNTAVNMRKVDGIIASCFPRIDAVIHDLKKYRPVVVIDNDSSDQSIPSVVIDNFNAVSDAVDHLLSLGHKRIGFVTGLEDSDVGRNRLAGYKHALSNHGIKLDDKLIFKGNYSFESGISGADYFLSLKKPPTAIMCANDSMAIGTLRRISQEGLTVPDDISILGFDDIYMASKMMPPLTTVSVPVQKMAKLAIDMLDAMIKGEHLDKWHIVVPGELVIRETSAKANGGTIAA